MNQNKIKNTKIGDDIHFYVNGVDDRGIVVKMNNEYVTVFKESTQAYDDIHINDTFFIKDILINKEWDQMDDKERYDALMKVHAPSPTYLMKTWEQLPKNLKDLLRKNNSIEPSHKEGKEDDTNVTARIFDKSEGGVNYGDGQGGGTKGKEVPSDRKPDTEHGETAALDAPDTRNDKKYRKTHIEEESTLEHQHNTERSRSGQEVKDVKVSGKKDQQHEKDIQSLPAAKLLMQEQENKLGQSAARQSEEFDAKQNRNRIDAKVSERKERKENQSDKVPKKVTEGVSALKAWQQWLAKRQEQINKDAKDGKQGGKPKEPREIYDDTGKKIKEPDSTPQSRASQELRGRIEDAGSNIPEGSNDVRHTELGVDRYHESVVGHNKEEYNQHEKDKKGNVRLGQRGQSDFSDTGSSSITSTDGQERDNKGKLTGKSWEDKLLELKSNVENSVHGNAARNPTAGVNTNTSFDAPKDYEGASHSGSREEQFKYEDKKPKVGQKLSKTKLNLGDTEVANPNQGTGQNGNPHNPKQHDEKDKNGRTRNQGTDKKQ